MAEKLTLEDFFARFAPALRIAAEKHERENAEAEERWRKMMSKPAAGPVKMSLRIRLPAFTVDLPNG